jgi:cytosolic prostaglandin-E synthase
MTAALQPQLKWAQRKDKLYLTVDLQDCASPEVSVKNEDGGGKFEFRGAAQGAQYELTVPLMHEIDPENTQIAKTPRNIFLIVPKKEIGDHWPRLTKEKGKQNHIQVDWGKYIDQDEEESGGDSYRPDTDALSGLEGMGGMGGMPGMGGMGGMPGMGGDGNLDMSKLQEMMAAHGDKDDDADGTLQSACYSTAQCFVLVRVTPVHLCEGCCSKAEAVSITR